jgi:hypothetical protein
MYMRENLFRVFKSGPWSAKRSLLAMLMTVVAVLILSLSARAWFAKTFTVTNPSPALRSSQETPLGVIRFTILPEGFDPPEATFPAGRYLMVVKNRSFTKDVSLRIDRAAGPHLKQVSVSKRNLDWHGEFDLTPGQYTISEANNPNWVANITITPK